MDTKTPLSELADELAEELDADIIFYNAPLQPGMDEKLIEEVIRRRNRKNVLLMLVTLGGDANVAYRVATCLQDNYEQFILYVPGPCKSAGTLVAIGAHKLIMSDHGQLGPLDVQMSKKDELWEVESGLIVMNALVALQREAFSMFNNFLHAFLVNIKFQNQGAITLKMAAKIATDMTIGLFVPLYQQIDPLRIGEVTRKMSIARLYGILLLQQGKNITEEKLGHLVESYPSHDFVINRLEAVSLFTDVREPNDKEKGLANLLGEQARRPISSPCFYFLSSEISNANENSDEEG